jgi:phenylacetic acid degradation operon negative regulatory protein
LLEPGTDRTSPGFAPGFAPAAPGVLVGFGPPPPDSLILTIDGDPKTLRRLAERAWKTDALADRYRAFLALIPETSESLDGLNAVVARVLMIHEYRRIALRDPHLPPPLLPPGWPGNVARERCAAWYEALRAPSELWLDTAENERGTLPQATHPRRFNLPNSLMHQA